MDRLNKCALVVCALFGLLTCMSSLVHAGGALDGVDEVKAIYDVRVKDAKRFAFFLDVIGKAYDGLFARGVGADVVVAVRGPSIRYLSTETWSYTEEDQRHLAKAASLLEGLRKRGIKIEACSIAAGLFKVDHSSYLPGVIPVENTFVSLIGYQAQGYALVPVN